MKKSLSLALGAASMMIASSVYAADMAAQNTTQKTELKTTRSVHCDAQENKYKKECAQTANSPSAIH